MTKTYAQEMAWTFDKRLGMKLEEKYWNKCKLCNNGLSHKYVGWATRDHKVIVYPDQWENELPNARIPDEIQEEDVTYQGNWEPGKWPETSNTQ